MLSSVRFAIGRMFSPKYLLVTNIASCGVLMATGDAVVQHIERIQQLDKTVHKKYDWPRTGRMFAIGIVMGPFTHGWYSILDRYLPSTAFKVVGKKILLDQTIAAPFFIYTFIMGMGLMEGKPFQECWMELRSKFWQVYKADWMVWPAAQSINFLFVPAHFRVIYVSAMMLCWDSFLSYIKHT